ncbi:hypothetical protein F4779DRAFT_602132 [Xylariaceae sp. FL0662B]|nr:hypothetical protein F4779DRAFT_602132 [Xylariaceae sp. FL0662B]
MEAPVSSEIDALVHFIASQCQSGQDFGSISVSIYDTAWLSMIRKPGVPETDDLWLFPECFEYVLDNQLPSGAWESYASDVDGIGISGGWYVNIQEDIPSYL